MARRHWAEIRQILEKDFLCESLKGRVRYFTTRYRKSHDQIGRVAVFVDNKEIINMPFSVENQRCFEVYKRKESGDQRNFRNILDEVFEEYALAGTFHPGDFGLALDEYLSNTIQASLISDNLLVKMFAILDRRVGKRTLIKFKNEVGQLPDWLQIFYSLRFKSENINQKCYAKLEKKL